MTTREQFVYVILELYKFKDFSYSISFSVDSIEGDEPASSELDEIVAERPRFNDFFQLVSRENGKVESGSVRYDFWVDAFNIDAIAEGVSSDEELFDEFLRFLVDDLEGRYHLDLSFRELAEFDE